MLEIRNLDKKYGSKRIISINQLKIDNGAIVGFFGENGSGKSTLFKCITNLVNYKGDVLLDGVNIKEKETIEKVGALIESPAFYNFLTARDNISYFIDQEDRIEYYLKKLNIFQNYNDKVKKYSLGMKQKLAIALAITKGTSLIILDEPYNGLDIKSVKVLNKMLLQEKDKGKIVLISSHNLKTLNEICDYSYYISKTTVTKIENSKNGTRLFMAEFLDSDKALAAFRNLSVEYEVNQIENVVYIKLTASDLKNDLDYELQGLDCVALTDVTEDYNSVMESGLL